MSGMYFGGISPFPEIPMAAAAAMIIRKQRETVEVFQGARATSPATARDPNDLGIDEGLVFRGLVDRAILRDAGNGRYYVDEPSWYAHNAMRRRRAFVVLAIVIILGAMVIGLGIARL